MRFKNDGNYTTYYGYFWNEVRRRWQLFTIGRVHRTKPLSEVKTNSFIEVPGVAESQRSNHKYRVVKYRGWVKDNASVWSEIDRMQSVVGNKEMTNGRWNIDEKGQFEVSAGGFAERMRTAVPTYKYKDPSENLPLYMKSKHLKRFFRNIP